MIFPQVDPKAWAERYKISPETHPCQKCGVPQDFTIPFASGKMRGLMADHKTCGPEFKQYKFVTTNCEFNDAVKEILKRSE